MSKRRYRTYIKKNTGLNLVALMDIFTVLVFFLLFNVHDEQSLTNSRVTNVPETFISLTDLKKDNSYDVLEMLSAKKIYFNNNVMGSDLIAKTLSEFCLEKKNKCEKLAIIASEDLKYSVVNEFVNIANVAGFIHVDLILRHST